MSRQITNFIFDIDGTLIDTYDMYMPAMIEIMEKHGYYVAADQVEPLKKKLFGITGTDSLRLAGIKEADIPAMVDEWGQLAFSREDQVKVFPEVITTLTELAQRPDTHLAIATSKNKDAYANHFANMYDWAQLFGAVVTEDQTTNHKPAPDPILLAMKKLNASPESAIYVGDTINDLKAAHNAGIKCAGALYGSSQPQNIAQADFPLQSPSDLLKID